MIRNFAVTRAIIAWPFRRISRLFAATMTGQKIALLTGRPPIYALSRSFAEDATDFSFDIDIFISMIDDD